MSIHQYAFDTQCQLILCCFMVHNFIRLNAMEEDIYYQDVEDVHERNDDDEDGPSSTWRDHIAKDMWNQYVAMMQLRK